MTEHLPPVTCFRRDSPPSVGVGARVRVRMCLYEPSEEPTQLARCLYQRWSTCVPRGVVAMALSSSGFKMISAYRFRCSVRSRMAG